MATTSLPLATPQPQGRPIVLSVPPADCSICPLRATHDTTPVGTVHDPSSLPPAFSPHPHLLAVGMNPGREEAVQGIPFVGPSGQLLRRVYLPQIRPHCTIWLANAARCWTPLDLQPKPRELKACSKAHLLADLQLLGRMPNASSVAVLLLGEKAVTGFTSIFGKALTHKEALLNQGRSWSVPGATSVVAFTTYHPAYLLRSPNMVGAVADHISLLERHLTGDTPAHVPPLLVPLRSPHKGTP